MIYVTDAHPLIFNAAENFHRLGRRARKIFLDAQQGKNVIVIPLTALEEIMRLTEKGLTKARIPFRRLIDEISEAPNFQIQPYTLEILLEAESLRFIRDPADRAIVATARYLKYPLITADEEIQEGDWVETVWD